MLKSKTTIDCVCIDIQFHFSCVFLKSYYCISGRDHKQLSRMKYKSKYYNLANDK